jgi:1,4-alpha-glucan branching enzyme
MYMDHRCGAWQVGSNATSGAIEFRIFFPDRNNASQIDLTNPAAVLRPTTYGDPRVKSIQVAGDFQHVLGQTDWDFNNAPYLAQTADPLGEMWTYTTPVDLPSNFYQYKYYVTFQDGTWRKVGDPCARYGGIENQNSGVVVGGSTPAQNALRPLKSGRQHLRNLIVYELMIDDFTDEYRGFRAPLDAARDKIKYLQESLGINAILFMPWTAWPSDNFSWGYTPHQYFAVEYRYADALNSPAEKLSWLKGLINECHDRDVHVIMDGVFNHVGDSEPSKGTAYGFPYHWLYQDPADSPYTGAFGGAFSGLQDIDYHNPCTQEFIGDVCFYWMDAFGIDGIRFDNTTNFYIDGDSRGLPKLFSDIRGRAADAKFSLTIEHLDMSAVDVANKTDSTSYWNNELYQRTFDYLWSGQIDSRIMGALDTHRGLLGDRVATVYLGNHDHSHVAWQAGARNNSGALEWYRVQPYAIELFTSPGAPMVQNGQEFAEDYWIMEDDHNSGRRVKPRPLRWGFVDDNIGSRLRDVFSRLINIRKQHLGLRSDNFYPANWETWQSQFNPQGFGVDVARGVVIFHRWGDDGSGKVERFIVVVNHSSDPRVVSVPFSVNGTWRDLLNDFDVNVTNSRIDNFTVNSHWGNVFFNS